MNSVKIATWYVATVSKVQVVCELEIGIELNLENKLNVATSMSIWFFYELKINQFQLKGIIVCGHINTLICWDLLH